MFIRVYDDTYTETQLMKIFKMTIKLCNFISKAIFPSKLKQTLSTLTKGH